MYCMNFLCVIALSRKTVAHTFLPSFDNANGGLCQERLSRFKIFCYHGNVTSRFSSLFKWGSRFFSLFWTSRRSCFKQEFCMGMRLMVKIADHWAVHVSHSSRIYSSHTDNRRHLAMSRWLLNADRCKAVNPSSFGISIRPGYLSAIFCTALQPIRR